MKFSRTNRLNLRMDVAVLGLVVILGVDACLALAGQGPTAPGRFLRGDVHQQTLEGKVRVTLHWEPAARAKDYVVAIWPAPAEKAGSEASAPENAMTHQVEVNRLIVTGLKPEQTYCWEVRARCKTDQPGVFSADGAGQFTTPVILQDNPEVDVPRTKSTVSIDGQVAPGEWDTARTLNLHRTVYGATSLPLVTPTVRIMYDEENLYLFFRSCTPGSRAVQAQQREHDGDVWQDDGFEVFLMPHGSTKYYQFLLNAQGSRAEGTHRNMKWNGPWQAAAKSYRYRMDMVIVAEIAIPWKTLGGKPQPGTEWKFNVVADFSPQAIIRSWAPVNGRNLHDPQRFGSLKITP